VADDPTPGELGRLIAGLTAKVGELSAAITALRGELVHRDVYAADRRADAERDQRMQADIDRLDREADEREQQRRSDRRWVVAAIVIPVALALVQLIASLRGGGA
jgi:hypothetical protein